MRKKNREVKDTDEIRSIISRCDVCRIALIDGDEPYIVTMNFGYLEGGPSLIYFHCANEGRKIDIIRTNNRVCFQMDTDHDLTKAELACDFTMKYSSIVGTGRIYIVDSEEERHSGLNCLMKQYSGKDDYSFNTASMKAATILRLEIEKLCAKRYR
jgi:nitroimidazol reductase NimA-like FMN-containing flavoprotein (pyridoxamine 5'-phosphate oxidase superfamily)